MIFFCWFASVSGSAFLFSMLSHCVCCLVSIYLCLAPNTVTPRFLPLRFWVRALEFQRMMFFCCFASVFGSAFLFSMLSHCVCCLVSIYLCLAPNTVTPRFLPLRFWVRALEFQRTIFFCCFASVYGCDIYIFLWKYLSTHSSTYQLLQWFIFHSFHLFIHLCACVSGSDVTVEETSKNW